MEETYTSPAPVAPSTPTPAAPPVSSSPSRLPSILGTALLFLLPFFFLPVLDSPFLWTNATLVSVIAFALVLLGVVGVFRNRRLSIPGTLGLGFVFLIPLAYAVSTILAGRPPSGLLGLGFEIDSALTSLTLALLLLGTALAFDSRRAILNALFALALGAGMLFLFVFLRTVGGVDLFDFGIFTRFVDNPLSSWTDLGIFYGLILLFLLSLLSFLPVSGFFRRAVEVGAVLSLLLVVVVGLERIWWIMFAVFVAILVFFGMRGRIVELGMVRALRFLWAPILVFLVSVLFIFFRDPLNARVVALENAIGVQVVNFEARPSWESSIAIVRGIYSSGTLPLIAGVGPTRFFLEWQERKPVEVNQTVYWNTDFGTAVGLIPTAFATAGLLGAVAWVLFLGWFLQRGVREVLRREEDRLSGLLVFTTFFLSSYLWVVAFLYAPRTPLFALAFIMTGLFIASLRVSGRMSVTAFTFDGPRGVIARGGTVTLGVITLVTAGFFLQHALAFAIFNSGARAFVQDNNPTAARATIERAHAISAQDLYARALVGLTVEEMRRVVQSATDANTNETLTAFQALLADAERFAVEAANLDPENYLNAMTAGSLYEAIAPLQVANAYENAKAAYTAATQLNPQNPLPHFALARLEAAVGTSGEDAIAHLGKALELKPNYADAYLLASEIARVQGNVDEAVAASLLAAQSSSDPSAYFRAGVLEFDRRNYRAAIENFNRAIQLVPEYSNARYFLGLSYERTGEVAAAIAELERVAALNPGNTDIESLLTELRQRASVPPPVPEEAEDVE